MSSTTTVTSIPVGNRHEPSPVHAIRTQAQRDAVLAIVAADDFDFACGNPLSYVTDDRGQPFTYTGPFAFTWKSKDGGTHSVRIGKQGNILRRVDP